MLKKLFGLFGGKSKTPESIEDAMGMQADLFIQSFTGATAPIDASKLDFTEASLTLVDQVLQDFYQQGVDLPEDLHYMASAYVLETARKTYGGEYQRFNEENPFVLVMGAPDCQVGFLGMEKVTKRAKNGPEDSLLFFFQGIAPLLEANKSAMLI